MTREQKTQHCPECGAPMRYEKHDDVLEYLGHRRVIKTIGWWCMSCGEGILTGDALVAHERAFQQLKAEVDGVLGPKEVARARGARAEPAQGGRGARRRPMSHLLRLIANEPGRLSEIVKAPAPKRSARKTRTSRQGNRSAG